jgi:DNA-binding transcriptional ArsR family regulator
MAEPLVGSELRVFRSLIEEWPWDTVEKIGVELTRGEELGSAEIEAALEALREKGYVEEFEPGRWQVTPNGHGVRRTLLGELRERGREELAEFAIGTELEGLGVRQIAIGFDERQDGEPVTRVLLLVEDPSGPTWDLPVVSELRRALARKAVELGLPAISISLVPVSDRDAAGRSVR